MAAAAAAAAAGSGGGGDGGGGGGDGGGRAARARGGGGGGGVALLVETGEARVGGVERGVERAALPHAQLQREREARAVGRARERRLVGLERRRVAAEPLVARVLDVEERFSLERGAERGRRLGGVELAQLRRRRSVDCHREHRPRREAVGVQVEGAAELGRAALAEQPRAQFARAVVRYSVGLDVEADRAQRVGGQQLAARDEELGVRARAKVDRDGIARAQRPQRHKAHTAADEAQPRARARRRRRSGPGRVVVVVVVVASAVRRRFLAAGTAGTRRVARVAQQRDEKDAAAEVDAAPPHDGEAPAPPRERRHRAAERRAGAPRDRPDVLDVRLRRLLAQLLREAVRVGAAQRAQRLALARKEQRHPLHRRAVRGGERAHERREARRRAARVVQQQRQREHERRHAHVRKRVKYGGELRVG